MTDVPFFFSGATFILLSYAVHVRIHIGHFFTSAVNSLTFLRYVLLAYPVFSSLIVYSSLLISLLDCFSLHFFLPCNFSIYEILPPTLLLPLFSLSFFFLTSLTFFGSHSILSIHPLLYMSVSPLIVTLHLPSFISSSFFKHHQLIYHGLSLS